jgi:putative ABC transport system substrate-binding protein
MRSTQFFACAIFSAWLMICPMTCVGQESAKVYTLLILDSQLGNPYDEVRGALAKALSGYGYLEGRNLRTTLKVSGNDTAQGERALREQLKKDHFDVIFVGGTAATISAKNALLGDMSQRIVFGAPTDPVGIGVIKDFSSKPFANFTGVCYPVPPKARFKFIKRLLPGARTFALIYADMPQSRSYNQWVSDLFAHDPEFKGLNIIFRAVPLITGENGDSLMAVAALPHIRELDAQVDAFIKPNDQMGTRRQFAEVVFKTATKPLIGITRDDVMGRWGSTAVIYPSHTSIGEQAARMVKDLFEGKAIADIPPEWPRTYGFAVDLPKARQFNLTVPVELLQLSGDNIIK